MKTNLRTFIVRLALLALAAFTFSSCVVTDASYSAYYDDGPYYERFYYDEPYYRTHYYPRPYGYYHYHTAPRYYPNDDCEPGAYRYRSSNGFTRTRDRYEDRCSRERSRNQEKIKLTDYNQKKTHGRLPEGYHTREWFEKRGYDLKKNTFKNQDGKYYGAGSDRKNSKNR